MTNTIRENDYPLDNYGVLTDPFNDLIKYDLRKLCEYAKAKGKEVSELPQEEIDQFMIKNV